MSRPKFDPEALRDWRVVAASEILTPLIFCLCLWGQGAPGWAYTLLVAVATRSSSLRTSAEVGTVQSAVRNLSARLDILTGVPRR